MLQMFCHEPNHCSPGLDSAQVCYVVTKCRDEEELQEEIESCVDSITLPSIPVTSQELKAYMQPQIEESECREYCKTSWPGID